MSNSPDAELVEILSDARAYLSIGDTHAGAAIILEAVRAHTSKEAQIAIGRMVGGHCLSLWKDHKSAEAKSLSSAILTQMLERGGKSVEPDYLDLYTTALAETGSSPFPWPRLLRHRNLLRIFDTVRHEAGDVAECGSARGLSSLELCLAHRRHYPDWQGAGFHVFDSFAGLSEPGAEDALDAGGGDTRFIAADMQPGRFAAPLEVVERNLRRLFPDVELHAGWIPAVLAAAPERIYRFVHIDVDLYQPTIDSLGYFFPRLAAGGIVLTDDYNWPGAKKAFDEFAARNALELQRTDTAQAYFVKERPPAS